MRDFKQLIRRLIRELVDFPTDPNEKELEAGKRAARARLRGGKPSEWPEDWLILCDEVDQAPDFAADRLINELLLPCAGDCPTSLLPSLLPTVQNVMERFCTLTPERLIPTQRRVLISEPELVTPNFLRQTLTIWSRHPEPRRRVVPAALWEKLLDRLGCADEASQAIIELRKDQCEAVAREAERSFTRMTLGNGAQEQLPDNRTPLLVAVPCMDSDAVACAVEEAAEANQMRPIVTDDEIPNRAALEKATRLIRRCDIALFELSDPTRWPLMRAFGHAAQKGMPCYVLVRDGSWSCDLPDCHQIQYHDVSSLVGVLHKAFQEGRKAASRHPIGVA